MLTKILNYTKDDLSELAEEIIALAKKKGASDEKLVVLPLPKML